jgi:hypothetical protein
VAAALPKAAGTQELGSASPSGIIISVDAAYYRVLSPSSNIIIVFAKLRNSTRYSSDFFRSQHLISFTHKLFRLCTDFPLFSDQTAVEVSLCACDASSLDPQPYATRSGRVAALRPGASHWVTACVDVTHLKRKGFGPSSDIPHTQRFHGSVARCEHIGISVKWRTPVDTATDQSSFYSTAEFDVINRLAPTR